MKLLLTLPQSLRLDISIGFALLLMLLQLATGTSLPFAELTFLAVVFSVIAVNLAGGPRTLAGCCVAIVALQTFVIAEVAKVFYGEPGQSRLQVPLFTMGVMALSMASFCLGSFVCRPFSPKRVLFRPTLDPELLRVMAVLSFIIGVGFVMSGHLAGETEDGAIRLGGVAGLLRRFSSCGPLAVIAGTAYTLVTSRGTRLFTVYNLAPIVAQFALGLFYSSKQGMFEPLFCLVLTAVAFRYSWRPIALLAGAFAVLFALIVLFPIAQVARNHTRGMNFADSLQKNIEYLSEYVKNPAYFLDQREEYEKSLQEGTSLSYFNHPNGVLERVTLTKPADALIYATLAQGTAGWDTITPGLADLLPRMILPRRFINVPNEMGYKAGFVDEDNIGTCIAFGFAADAFNSFGWAGVAIVPFLLAILLIVVTRFLTPPMPCNVWWAFFFTIFNHGLAEADIGSVIGLFIVQTAWVALSLSVIILSAKIWITLTRQKRIRGESPAPYSPVGEITLETLIQRR